MLAGIKRGRLQLNSGALSRRVRTRLNSIKFSGPPNRRLLLLLLLLLPLLVSDVIVIVLVERPAMIMISHHGFSEKNSRPPLQLLLLFWVGPLGAHLSWSATFSSHRPARARAEPPEIVLASTNLSSRAPPSIGRSRGTGRGSRCHTGKTARQ